METKIPYTFTLVLLWCCICNTVSWRVFHKGRSSGGNLGLPNQNDLVDDSYVSEKWFKQSLDHFTPGDERTWLQRYFVNTEYFKNITGPIFLMIGGEGEASKSWMTRGTWIDYAKKFGALCFQLEHRYYGKSHPTEDLSTKNLQYLSSEQALADLSVFIVNMNNQYSLPSDVKWIVFGGSYPGSLAAWLRMKYPHLVHAAVSSSGPLLAKVDFMEYYKVVEDALDSYRSSCTSAIKQGTSQINILLRHKIGQRHINEKFKLCDSIEESVNDENDISNFYESLASNFAGVVQYNKDNRITNGTKINITIDMLCDIMVNEDLGTPVARLASVNLLLMNSTNQKCLDYKYNKMITELSNTSWTSTSSEGGRQWTYQTCTEFGFYQTSSYVPQIFGYQFPVNFFIKQCIDIFGPKFSMNFINAAANYTNTYYGGLAIEVSNVVFVHGTIDPWHALGITETVNQMAPAIFINGTAHCANMYPESANDLPQLKAAREQIAQLIGSWIR